MHPMPLQTPPCCLGAELERNLLPQVQQGTHLGLRADFPRIDPQAETAARSGRELVLKRLQRGGRRAMGLLDSARTRLRGPGCRPGYSAGEEFRVRHG